MNTEKLYSQIKSKSSFLCVGLDTDIRKTPSALANSADKIFDFNREIIDATAEFAVSYKPNLAFYEEQGEAGWRAFVRTVEYIKKNYPDQFVIADAKRGDIGNTSAMYARAFFDEMDLDAVTLAPYMGRDTVQPFLEYEGRFAVVLALTSNPSAADFELLKLESGERLFEQVLKTTKEWGTPDNMMYVVGATKATELRNVRSIIPDHFLLVPGVGAQGGSLAEVYENGANAKCGLLVNSSRGIIYASSEADFASRAHEEAAKLQAEMAMLMNINK